MNAAAKASLPPSDTDRPGAAEAHIPGDRRHALAHGVAIPDRVHGAGLFADISGFTPLTDALARELGPQRGAEELTTQLNRVFFALIEDVARCSGHVVYFSGDALTCWFDGDDGLRATACALAMQRAIGGIGRVVTPSGTEVELALKVAVAVGDARRFIVGHPAIQLIDVLAGKLIDALAAAEHQADRGEVILDRSAIVSLGDRVRLRAFRADADEGRACGVVAALVVPVDIEMAPHAVAREDVPLAPDVAKQWLLPAVHDRLRGGEFLTELRPAFPVFLRFGGIDYDQDEAACAKLDAFIRAVQRIVSTYGGSVLHLTLGDKGAYLYAVFGAPQAHEDDAARAAFAALELAALAGAVVTDIQIGIAHGRLRSGLYGHPRRQTFTCFGDAVNLAARLMTAAPPARIYVSEPVQRAAGAAFAFEALAPLNLKGRREPVAAFALTGSMRECTRARASNSGAIVGRATELAALHARLDATVNGHGCVLGLAGEAGIGKSRLVAEFAQEASARGVRMAAGECLSYGRNMSYHAWRSIWSTLFDVDHDASPDEQVTRVENALAAIDPMLAPRAPLLASLLDLPIPDNELTSQFDAKLRKTSLEGLLGDALRAQASRTPVALVIEDAHWIDPLSRDLVEVLARSVAELPIAILLAYRPGSDEADVLRTKSLPHFDEIRLRELTADETQLLMRARLSQQHPTAIEPPPALVELVVRRTQGNPFYIEELLAFIAREGVDPQDERALQRLQLPDSLHSLILSRIDRLDEDMRQILKVASVVGRTFDVPMLAGVYPQLGDAAGIREHLRGLGAGDLLQAEPGVADGYVFTHAATREVAYESLPFAFRSTLHERAGDYIEETQEEAIERNLDLLAHHYWRSDNRDRKREYLGRAGAAAQASYANAAAIDYFERLAPLLSQGSRLDVLLKLGKVLELVGNWRRAEEVDGEALALAENLDDGLRRASCQTALAEVVRKQGRYAEAFDLLNRAARGFASFGDEAGVARVQHLTGTVAAQRGDYDKALASYRKSLQIREKIGDKASMASLLSNLGIVAEYRGEYENAAEFHGRALTLRESVGDRWAIANSMTNVGMIAALQKRYDEAREWFEKAMAINREVGDAWMVAICHNNLGNANRGLGDRTAARAHYAESLRAYRDYDDRWALAFLLEDVGVLAALDDRAVDALTLVGAADALREAIGAARAPSLEREITDHLAPALASLPEDERAARRAQGRALDTAGAIALAFVVCADSAPAEAPSVGGVYTVSKPIAQHIDSK